MTTNRFALSDEHHKLLAQIKLEDTIKAMKNNTPTTFTHLVNSSKPQKPINTNTFTDLYNKLNLSDIKTSLAASALTIVVNSFRNHMAAVTPTSTSAKIKYVVGLAVLALSNKCVEAYFSGIVDGAFDEVLSLILDVCRSYLGHL